MSEKVVTNTCGFGADLESFYHNYNKCYKVSSFGSKVNKIKKDEKYLRSI